MSFLGSKAAPGVVRAIISQFPPHDTYIETHLGTGAVMRTKERAARNVGVDLDLSAFKGIPPPYHVELHQCDCVRFLERFDFASAGRVLIYADPPYMLETRTSSKRYRFDYSDADHVRLLSVLKSLSCSVVVSGYPAALYDRELAGWRTVEFQAMTRGGVRTEKLWMNFAASAVHWATFAGDTFTRRQQIKRQAERWKARFSRMEPDTRLAILAALLEAESAIADGNYVGHPSRDRLSCRRMDPIAVSDYGRRRQRDLP